MEVPAITTGGGNRFVFALLVSQSSHYKLCVSSQRLTHDLSNCSAFIWPLVATHTQLSDVVHVTHCNTWFDCTYDLFQRQNHLNYFTFTSLRSNTHILQRDRLDLSRREVSQILMLKEACRRQAWRNFFRFDKDSKIFDSQFYPARFSCERFSAKSRIRAL